MGILDSKYNQNNKHVGRDSSSRQDMGGSLGALLQRLLEIAENDLCNNSSYGT